MTKISRNALLPYSVKRVFELINDIAAYPQYMRGCVGAEILEQGDNYIVARLDLAKAGLRQSFSTRNTLKAPTRVEMVLIEGPFDDFLGVWELLPLGDNACKVSLNLTFGLSNKAVGAAAKILFNPMADNLVDAMVKRAHHLHKPT